MNKQIFIHTSESRLLNMGSMIYNKITKLIRILLWQEEKWRMISFFTTFEPPISSPFPPFFIFIRNREKPSFLR